MEKAYTFKVSLIGDGGVGKTTYMQKLLGEGFNKKYIATLAVHVHRFTIDTNYGRVKFDVWDCAGQEKFGGLRDGYYIKSDAAILMFDVTSITTFKNLTHHKSILSRVKGCDKIPKVYVANKIDVSKTRIPENIMTNDALIKISVKNNIQLYEPFIFLMKQLIAEDIVMKPLDQKTLTPLDMKPIARL